jgi:hypothetical protein
LVCWVQMVYGDSLFPSKFIGNHKSNWQLPKWIHRSVVWKNMCKLSKDPNALFCALLSVNWILSSQLTSLNVVVALVMIFHLKILYIALKLNQTEFVHKMQQTMRMADHKACNFLACRTWTDFKNSNSRACCPSASTF